MHAGVSSRASQITFLYITCTTVWFMRWLSWGAQVSYKSYWIRAILEVLHAGRGTMMSIQDVSNVTGIHPGDVREAMGTLQLTQSACPPPPPPPLTPPHQPVPSSLSCFITSCCLSLPL